jgi:phage shock protein PspC (stress-responsive transcriptional regulator)
MTETATTTYKELRRSRSDRMLAGVCGGLGRYFDVNPVFYRVAFVVLTLIGGAGILIYGACLLVIPNEGEQDSIASDVLRNHRQRPVALVALGLVALAGIALLSHLSFRIHSDGFWIAVLVVGALLLGASRRERRAATVAVAPAAAAAEEPATVVAAPPKRRGRNPFLWALAVIGLLFASAVITVAAYGISYLHLGDGVGNRNYAPVSVSAIHDYRLGVGHLKVDLSKLDVTQPTTVDAHLGMGSLDVIVPRGVKVRVLGHATWGDVTVLGNDNNGHDVDTNVGAENPELTIDAHVDAGQIRVERALP